MVYYVYLDPETLSKADDLPDKGLGILRSLSHAVLLFGFDDARTRKQIGFAVHNVSDPDLNKRLQLYLQNIVNSNRFIELLSPEYCENRSDLQSACEQAQQYELDAVISITDGSRWLTNGGTEFIEASKFSSSLFEDKRHLSTSSTKAYKRHQLESASFLETNFSKAFKYATEIHIVDKLAGEKFGDNFEFSIKRLLKFFQSKLNEPGKATVQFFTCPSARSDHFETVLKQHGAGLGLKVVYIDANTATHDRFISSNHFSFHIGRGMDFLDAQVDRNDDTTFGFCDFEVPKHLSSAAKILN